MATYAFRVVKKARYEWVVPAAEPGGAAITEVYKAVSAAETRWVEVHGEKPNYDNWCSIGPSDNGVVIWFDTEEVTV